MLSAQSLKLINRNSDTDFVAQWLPILTAYLRRNSELAAQMDAKRLMLSSKNLQQRAGRGRAARPRRRR